LGRAVTPITFSVPQIDSHFQFFHIDLYQRAKTDGRA
jgi:hypothetical protein